MAESVYDRAARLCKNAKTRQDKQKDKGVELIAERAAALPADNKIIMLDISGLLVPALTGVLAIKISEMFKKPCILLNKFFDKKMSKSVYRGSGRNFNYSPVDSFKDVINNTGVFSFGKGHANAFGVGLDTEKFNEAVNALNEALKNIEYDTSYKVDFILSADDVTAELVTEFRRFENIICQGIEEPVIAVENITLTRDCFEIFGKNEDTISFNIDGVKYIQFKCKEDNPVFNWFNDTWNDDDSVTFSVVGSPSVNNYKGIETPQIIIKDLELSLKE